MWYIIYLLCAIMCQYIYHAYDTSTKTGELGKEYSQICVSSFFIPQLFPICAPDFSTPGKLIPIMQLEIVLDTIQCLK